MPRKAATRALILEIRDLIAKRDAAAWGLLVAASADPGLSFDELFLLSRLRKRCLNGALGPWSPAFTGALKIAIVGSGNLNHVVEFVEHHLMMAGIAPQTYLGAFDGYVNEILDAGSPLYRHQPELVVLLPDSRSLPRPTLATAAASCQESATQHAHELAELVQTLFRSEVPEVVVANLPLPWADDLGPLRTRSPASAWNVVKTFNTALTAALPPAAMILDVEFLSARAGTAAAADLRSWFATRQPYAPDFQAHLAGELASLIKHRKAPIKKVLVLDLDGTLWGGVIGDDGLAGIELGNTTSRGEAYKELQLYIRGLQERGVLLCVCSKNEDKAAREPFERHPDMVLRLADITLFQASWRPKSEVIAAMATALDLGLDSFVFLDDNPAELDIVRQFLPQVVTLQASDDPCETLATLLASRLFAPQWVTAEDAEKTAQYRAEAARHDLKAVTTDVPGFLRSLAMRAIVQPFLAVDVPRIAQLINKSNQFNLTTRRRTVAEVAQIVDSPTWHGLSFRLKDRFGDYGLVAALIFDASAPGPLVIDTWVMSCRVLSRQVEHIIFNAMLDLARALNRDTLRGVYLPTRKNELVKDLYERLGFSLVASTTERGDFALPTSSAAYRASAIEVEGTRNDGAGDHHRAAGSF